MKTLYLFLLLLCFSSFAKAQSCFPSTECSDAPLFCGYMLENTLFNNSAPSLHTSTPPSCIPTLHNSNWFAIVPCSNVLDLTILVQSSFNAEGLQVALFSACQAPSSLLYCQDGQGTNPFDPINVIAPVVPGQTYFLQVDGDSNDICDYVILVNSGLDVSPPPATPFPTVGGSISSSSGTGGFCNSSGSPVASFSADWPGCDAFSSPQLSCYTPPADSCNGIKWTLPPGAIVVGDPYANPVTVNLQFVVAGTYTIRAKPMECGCPDLCDECGQACCPVEELSLQITIGGSCNEDCSDFENPAPPGDNCAEAPFLCGNYLDGYCSSNAGLSNDTLNGMVLRNSGFLRLSPCDDSLHLRIRARNCTSSNGLIAWLMRGTCDEPELIGSVAITNGAFSDFIFNDLTPDETYFLVFEGGSLGTICELYIEVVSGIGTATPDGSNVTCDCTDGSIDGPSDLCPADVAVYTLSPGSCTIIDGPPTVGNDPGNGYFCCPESSEDSFQLVWHIPSSMNFLSDSINVNTITVQVDSNLLGRDTLIMDSIWISYEFITPPDATVDSLIYCDCPGYSGCLPGISAKQVTIRHDVEMEFCELTCVMPFCIIEGMTYTAPTSDTLQSNCLTRIVQIIDNQVPPPVFIAPVLPLNCANPTRTLSVNTPMQNTFIQWDGPGIVTNPNAPSITVNAQGFYNCIVSSFLTGCVSAAQVFVGSNFIEPTVVISPDNSICQGGSIEIGSSGSSVGTNFQYNWSTGATTSFIQVSPNVTTTYSLTITNLTNGCEETASMTVTVEPLTIIQLNTVAQITCAQPCVTYLNNEYCAPGTYIVETFDCEITRFTIGEDLSLPTIMLPIVTLCEGECYTFYGQEYCASAVLTQEDNCTIFVQEIVVNPPTVIDLGEVAQITCAQPCVTYLGNEYCAAGTYEVQTGACEISRFIIGEDLSLPTITLPVVTLCEGECYTFYGQEYCASAVLTQEDNCSIFVQEIIVNPSDTLDLGEVAQITCTQPCVTYLGNEYCAAGTYEVQTGACEISRFIIGEDLSLPMITLPVVTLCEGECYTFYGQQYCASAVLMQEDNCSIFVQEIVVNSPTLIDLGEVAQITCAQPCVTYLSNEYCAAGTYEVQTGACEISRFIIGEDLSLPTITLPIVTLCEGECYTFYGQEYCASAVLTQEDNCNIFVQEIVVNPPTIVQAGVVGSISCGEPCFSFMGTNYCATGQYVDTTDCLLTVFDIEFAKDTQDVGLLGTLTCSQSCFSFLQELYCEAGDYVVSDTCTIFRFSIASNVAAPVCSTPMLNCLPSNAQYTVGFSISGTPPYKVNGEPISGSYFLSDPIASGTDYAFIVEQVNNDCQTLLNGTYDCAAACANDPGALQTNTLHTCTGDQATAQVLTPAVVSTGQVAEFILHTLSGNTLGVVLARNTDGVFAFDAETMAAEETYYISSAAGPADAEGLVDFTNACAKITPGQPVIFHALPTFGNVISENPSCFGEADGFINALHAHAASPLQYALNAGIFSNQFLFEGLEAETYTLRLRDTFGCQRDTVLTLVAPDSLWLTLTPDQEITRGETIVLQAETNAGAGLPVWTNDQNAAQQEGFDLEVQPQATTRYFCTVSNGNDCIVSGSLLLKVRSGQVYFPNVIAPRGADASNQGFTLFAPEGYLQEIRSLKIFDRWGATVFQRNHFAPNMPELGWDGSIRGRAANSAVFVFMAEVLLPDGSIEIISGDVTVL